MKISCIFLFLLPVAFAMPRVCRFRPRCRTARVRLGVLQKLNQGHADEPNKTYQQVDFRPVGSYGATSNTQRGYFLEQIRANTNSSQRINDIMKVYLQSLGR